MGELKDCPADFMAYVKKLPKDKILLDDVAQVIWLWVENSDEGPKPMSYKRFFAHCKHMRG